MNQEVRPAFCSEIILNPNKIIIYKGKNYSVDFDLIKRNCKYFYEHSSEFEQKEKIEITEPIDLPVETFQTFLNCSQNQLTYIEDILGINYLSIKYQNEKLVKFTQDYIEKNYNQLIFQSISFKRQVQQAAKYPLKKSEINIDTSNEEKILSSHFMEYIEDERIFTLPINMLDRVMKKFVAENKELFDDENAKKKVDKFLLRCLREYKTPASVLFLNISFDKLDRDLIVSLHKDFADIFDFNMINARSLFDTTYNLVGENSKILSLVKDLSEKQEEQMSEFAKYKASIDQELKKIRDEQEKHRERSDQNQSQFASKLQILEGSQSSSHEQLSEYKRASEEKEKAMKAQLDEMKKKLEAQEEAVSKQASKIQELETRLQGYDDVKNKLAQQEQIIGQYQRTNDLLQISISENAKAIKNIEEDLSVGIIAHLTQESGGNVCDNGTVKVTASSVNDQYEARYAVDFNEKQKYFQSQNIQNSWLKYDFGSRKVRPVRYTIKSRNSGSAWCMPRNWVIEGTNIDSDADSGWTVLDNRINDKSIDGNGNTSAFEIKNQQGSFRFFRIRQTGENSSGSYYLTFSNIEFFGIIKT